jgi:hypothetical protein
MEKKNLLFESSAIKFALDYLRTRLHYKWRKVEYLNLGRYAVVYGNPNVCITFKKAWFLKFQEICGGEGLGDTVNVTDLQEMVKRQVKDIYIVYKEGYIYTISLLDFLANSYKWQNKEGKEVRSISLRLYNRVNKDDT